ncbi:MAG: cysteine methyltransferase [Frankiales bacterium]|jgi:methylated-DNA-[protein]-cysteine S-methyltransferase|nr:cysteine methyltransferase [Frankiales bacterium]
MFHALIPSPIGEILLTGDGSALSGLYTSEHVRRPASIGARDDLAFTDARDQLAEYFAGDRTEFDLALRLVGTPFQLRVWEELRRIGHGQTTSYGQLALRMGAPSAVRAVGMANGRNPISIVVPCHRVIASDGQLTGYAGGLAAKRWLLEHESPNHDRLAG